MISHLHIENYALIEHLDLNLEGGFTVITGETGAGKSILLGAIGLVLGNRADSKSIKAGEHRCVVEATFDLSKDNWADFFSDNDLDFDGVECIVRRELTSTGKSRAFINDTPVQLSLLKTLGEHLIDIHSQHQNLLLSQSNFQLSVLDTIAENTQSLESYQAEYMSYMELCHNYEQAVTESEQNHDDEEYLRFQLQQLTEADLKADEQAEFEAEQELLEHAEEVKQSLYTAAEALQATGDGTDVLGLLRTTMQSIERVKKFLPAAEELYGRLNSCYIELQDIADDVNSKSESIEYNPERMTYVTERLNTIYSLQKKHKVTSIPELLSLKEEMERKMNLINNSDNILEELKKKRDYQYSVVINAAGKLSTNRKKAAKILQEQILKRLQPLGMPNVQFEVNIENTLPTSTGTDNVTFLFSANKNVPTQPISKIASGGEIARLMLSLKSILASKTNLPTIIFDEIDTGVSGSIAEKMAHIMEGMADHGRQVISITHLPQIAAIGTHHLKVYKDDVADTTQSHIVTLNPEERVEEIAHMLSGAVISKAALDNARALLEK